MVEGEAPGRTNLVGACSSTRFTVWKCGGKRNEKGGARLNGLTDLELFRNGLDQPPQTTESLKS